MSSIGLLGPSVVTAMRKTWTFCVPGLTEVRFGWETTADSNSLSPGLTITCSVSKARRKTGRALDDPDLSTAQS